MTNEDLISSIKNGFDDLVKIYSQKEDFTFTDFALTRMVLYDALEVIYQKLLEEENND